jgi:hypothetical protein
MGPSNNISAHNKFAGHDDNQSGLRFLDSSAPRLIRHVESCDTAGRGIIPPPAGKDQKLSRGAGQRPAVSAREARLPSSLDSIKNNRGKSRDPYRKKNMCGQLALLGFRGATNGLYSAHSSPGDPPAATTAEARLQIRPRH